MCLLSPTEIFPFRNCIQYFKRVKHYPFCRLPFSGIKRSTPPDTFPLMRARSTEKRKNAPSLLYFVLSSATTSPWFAFMVPGLNRCTLRFVYFLEEPSSSQCYFRLFVGILVICSFLSSHTIFWRAVLIYIHPRRLRDFLLFFVQMRL